MSQSTSYESTSSSTGSGSNSVSNSSSESARSKLREPLSALKEDFVQLGKVSQKVADDSLDQVRQGLKGYYNIGHDKMQEVEEKIEGKIREHPLRSLLVAAGVGFFVGWLRKKM